MALDIRSKPHLQFILFGGKGGVGKTTMAAATAIRLAEQTPEQRLLIFTTDPAPSLGDSFGQELSNEPTRIRAFPNLWALEVDAREELARFRKEYGGDILDILQEGTYLSTEETEDMFSLDIPGLDEVMGMKKIMDFMDSKAYDRYILDTAPTGHTLRLLALPELLDDWIKFLARLRWKYHAVVHQLSRGATRPRERADEFLLTMKKTVQRVRERLRDAERTTFVVVTIAEAMAVAETEDLIRDLRALRIPSTHIIINNVMPNDPSPFLRSRRSVQNRHIAAIRKTFPEHTVTEVELAPHEVRGIEHLTALGRSLIP